MQAEGLMKRFRFEDKNPSSLVNVDYIIYTCTDIYM